MDIDGSVTNNGTIVSNIMNISGHILNFGSWTSSTRLTGEMDRKLDGSHPIMGEVKLTGDTTFLTNVSLFAGLLSDGHKITLPPNGVLKLQGPTLMSSVLMASLDSTVFISRIGQLGRTVNVPKVPRWFVIVKSFYFFFFLLLLFDTN